jgi:hypothetical protein
MKTYRLRRVGPSSDCVTHEVRVSNDGSVVVWAAAMKKSWSVSRSDAARRLNLMRRDCRGQVDRYVTRTAS